MASERHYANPAYGRLMARADERNRPVGTALSGYAPAKDGPFRCDNCVHFHLRGGDKRPSLGKGTGTCDHPTVQADPDIRVHQDGKPVVEAGGCCNEFRGRGAGQDG